MEKQGDGRSLQVLYVLLPGISMTLRSDDLAVNDIIAAGRFLAAKGWAPATSGNYSMRVDGGRIAITVSGAEKGELTRDDIMFITKEGVPLDQRKPSAETLLHVGIYASCEGCNAILHTHSPTATIYTKSQPALKAAKLRDYEILKVYPTIKTHDTEVLVPIFDNTQDMQALRAQADKVITSSVPAYLIRGHGLYGWGATMAEARRVTEATEFMLACELELMRA